MGRPGERNPLYGSARTGGRRSNRQSAVWSCQSRRQAGRKLPFTYEDVPSSEVYGKTTDALYQEGVYVGYRYYDKSGTAVRWPFGYGLSYTSFAYSDLTADGDTVSVAVKNTCAFAGAEVVQLYMKGPQDGLHRPLRELKGFQKVFL